MSLFGRLDPKPNSPPPYGDFRLSLCHDVQSTVDGGGATRQCRHSPPRVNCLDDRHPRRRAKAASGNEQILDYGLLPVLVDAGTSASMINLRGDNVGSPCQRTTGRFRGRSSVCRHLRKIASTALDLVRTGPEWSPPQVLLRDAPGRVTWSGATGVAPTPRLPLHGLRR